MKVSCISNDISLADPVDHGPVLPQLVLQRVARQRDALLGLKFGHGNGHPRLGISQLMRLVSHHHVRSMLQLLEGSIFDLQILIQHFLSLSDKMPEASINQKPVIQSLTFQLSVFLLGPEMQRPDEVCWSVLLFIDMSMLSCPCVLQHFCDAPNTEVYSVSCYQPIGTYCRNALSKRDARLCLTE